MAEGILIPFLGLMTIQAVDAILAMLAFVPFPIQAGVLGHVAIDALLARGCAPIDPDLAGRAVRLGRPVGQQEGHAGQGIGKPSDLAALAADIH